MSEILVLKVSWATDLSPTASFSLADGRCGARYTARVGREGVPGVWDGGWVLEGLYRVPTSTLQDPIFSHILASGPYLRPNEGKSGYFYEVPQIWPQIWPQNDPE